MSPASTAPPSPRASPLPRRQNTDLQPLRTHSPEYERRISIQSTTIATFPSPSLVAARAYYLENTAPIRQNCNALQRRRSLFEVQQIPRRGSILAASGEGVDQTTHSVSPQSQVVRVTQDTAFAAPTAITIKVEKDGDSPVERNESPKAETPENVPERPTQSIWAGVDVPIRVPFQFSHNHLREWGNVYLGCTATADAFINAVSLRRPSLVLEKEKLGGKVTGSLVTIRARVLPRAKDNKPFLITKKFDIEELRAGIPPVERVEGEAPVLLRRSSRFRRPSTQNLSDQGSPRRGSADSQLGMEYLSLEKSTVPIHIEYALHYIPVLAAIMLSGHVKKGDTIDLPVPNPESWRDTISYVYTGKGPVTSCMRSNILHLAGHV